MPPPTTFGALGHIFDTRDSAELLQDSFGKKKLKPLYDRGASLKYTVLCTKDAVETEIFDKYRRRQHDATETAILSPKSKAKKFFHSAANNAQYVFVSKYGTSLGQGDMRLLPASWVKAQRRKARPESSCSSVSQVSELCVTEPYRRQLQSQEWYRSQRPQSMLEWIDDKTIQEESQKKLQEKWSKNSALRERQLEDALSISRAPTGMEEEFKVAQSKLLARSTTSSVPSTARSSVRNNINVSKSRVDPNDDDDAGNKSRKAPSSSSSVAHHQKTSATAPTSVKSSVSSSAKKMIEKLYEER
eukprot:PhF_6_TR30462/c0_g1_i1/m.44748